MASRHRSAWRRRLGRSRVGRLAIPFAIPVVLALIIAAVVYYLIVAPSVKLTARLTRTAEATTRDCPECLSTIPIAASRCMYCTSQVPPVNPAPPTSARHRAAPQQYQQPQQYHQ